MADKWEEQLKEFWKRAGVDLKRTTDDLRQEAQKLVGQVQDPANQEKLKQGLREFGTWTRKTVEEAALKFEKAIDRAGDRVGEWAGSEKTSGSTSTSTGDGASKEAKAARPRAKAVAKAKAASKSTGGTGGSGSGGGAKKKAKGKTPNAPAGKRK